MIVAFADELRVDRDIIISNRTIMIIRGIAPHNVISYFRRGGIVVAAGDAKVVIQYGIICNSRIGGGSTLMIERIVDNSGAGATIDAVSSIV